MTNALTCSTESGRTRRIIEALIYVSDEPLSCESNRRSAERRPSESIEEALTSLAEEFNARNGGLQLREVAGGWQFATRPEYHEHVRAFLKTRPSAKLTWLRWKRWQSSLTASR